MSPPKLPPIYRAVSASDSVKALLGDDVRFSLWGEAGYNEVLPYATWQVISGSPENYCTNTPDIDSYTLQVDIYALTGKEAEKIRDAICEAIEGLCHIVAWRTETERSDNESRPVLRRISFDCDWWIERDINFAGA